MPDENQNQMIPCIMMPNKMFLIGSILGIDLGRRIERKNNPIREQESGPPSQVNYMGKEAGREDFNAMYHGSFLHLDCPKCGRTYTFDGINDIPEHSLICATDDCGNILIMYDVLDFSQMRIGNIKIVG